MKNVYHRPGAPTPTGRVWYEHYHTIQARTCGTPVYFSIFPACLQVGAMQTKQKAGCIPVYSELTSRSACGNTSGLFFLVLQYW